MPLRHTYIDHEELVSLADAIGLPGERIKAGTLLVDGDTVTLEELPVDTYGLPVGGKTKTRRYQLRRVEEIA